METEANWTDILAKNVRVRRQALGRSQEDLANEIGVDVRYLGGIERGQRNPSLKVIAAIAAALRIHPADLLLSGQAGLSATPARTCGDPKGE